VTADCCVVINTVVDDKDEANSEISNQSKAGGKIRTSHQKGGSGFYCSPAKAMPLLVGPKLFFIPRRSLIIMDGGGIKE
jgi:hypothetical protein